MGTGVVGYASGSEGRGREGMEEDGEPISVES